MMTYAEENDKLLEHVLFRSHVRNKVIHELEVIVTPECNLKCEYCYFNKHSDLLYPKDIRCKEVIIKNLKLLLRYLKDKHLTTKSISLFSGEIWGSEYGMEILDILYKESILHKFTNVIAVPSNCSFTTQEEYSGRFQQYINDFKAIGIKLYVSCSIDGGCLDDKQRPQRNGEAYSEDRYSKIVDFVLSNGFGFHPMVSPESTKDWIPNYDWFISKLDQYGVNRNRLMMLEVRDGDWNNENIESYKKFIKHVFDYKLQNIYENDVKLFLVDNLWLQATGAKRIMNYNNIELRVYEDRIPCSIQNTLFVRLGDLAIVPCHRTMYDKFIYGHFKVEDNHITGIEAKNPELAIKILSANPNHCFYGCDACEYKHFCMKPCIGAMYEQSGDIFHGNLDGQLCNMFKAKIDTTIELYESLGLFEMIRNDTLKSPNRQRELELYHYFTILKEGREYNERHKS